MEPSQEIDPQAVQKAAERLWRQRWPEKVGRLHGQQWALTVASYSDIMWVLGLLDQGAGLAERLQAARGEKEHFEEDWSEDYEGLDDERFWQGFAAGVAEVWAQVRDQVEAEVEAPPK